MKTVVPYILICLLGTGVTVFATDESPIKAPPLSYDSSAEIIAAAKARGAMTAAQDIKTGIFRILEFGEPRLITPDTKDDQTGFKILVVGGCEVSQAFIAEADAYNGAMRDWQAKHVNEPARR